MKRVESITDLIRRMPDLNRQVLNRWQKAGLISEWNLVSNPRGPGRIAELTEKHVEEIEILYEQYQRGMNQKEMIDALAGPRFFQIERVRRSRIKLAARYHAFVFGLTVSLVSVEEAFDACGIIIGRQTQDTCEGLHKRYAETIALYGLSQSTGPSVQYADVEAVKLFFIWLDKMNRSVADRMNLNIGIHQDELAPRKFHAGHAISNERSEIIERLTEALQNKAAERYYVETR